MGCAISSTILVLEGKSDIIGLHCTLFFGYIAFNILIGLISSSTITILQYHGYVNFNNSGSRT